MSGFSPAVILFDENGIAMAVPDGLVLPANTRGLMLLGKDGMNSRFIRVASDGAIKIDPTGITTQPISASELPLPIGAATETTLGLLENILVAIRDTAGVKKITNALPVGDNGIGRFRLWDGTNL